MQLPFKIQLKTAPWERLGDRLVDLQAMSPSSGPGRRAPAALVRCRTCWPFHRCVRPAQTRLLANDGNFAVALCRALSQAKRAGFLWRQTFRERRSASPGSLSGGPAWRRGITDALDILFELDLRLMCEASGQDHFMQRQPRQLQHMLSKPGLVLARPDWLRAFLFNIWIGVHQCQPSPRPQPALK